MSLILKTQTARQMDLRLYLAECADEIAVARKALYDSELSTAQDSIQHLGYMMECAQKLIDEIVEQSSK